MLVAITAIPESVSGAGRQTGTARFAHYDGRTWSIVSTLDKGQQVSAIQGTIAPDQSRRLVDLGGDCGNRATLLPPPATKERVVGSPLFTRTIIGRTRRSYSIWKTLPKGCTRIFGSVVSPTEAWFSDVLFRLSLGWERVQRSRLPSTDPLGKLMGLWAASGEEACVRRRASRAGVLQHALPTRLAVRRTRNRTVKIWIHAHRSLAGLAVLAPGPPCSLTRRERSFEEETDDKLPRHHFSGDATAAARLNAF